MLKRGLIAWGAFLASYVALNGGLGPHPVRVLVPLLTVLATVFAVGRLMQKRAARRTETAPLVPLDAPVREAPRTPLPTAAKPGGKARKLF